MDLRTSRLLKGLSEKDRVKQLAAIERNKTKARQGQRIVVVCDHDACDPRWRRFCSTEEEARTLRCPDHGRGVRQGNNPYLGASTV